MGLCKCPLKKVTNLFCFEHRVNVCDSCLLSNHAQCIVQTYLKWLQDSEYVPQCRLCNTLLNEHPTVRLSCLHVYHKHCLTNHAQSLPPTTAPASYTCLTCQEGIFPDASNKSPIAEALRKSLATETWARPGLGLPVRERIPDNGPPGPPQLASTPAPHRTAPPVFPEHTSKPPTATPAAAAAVVPVPQPAPQPAPTVSSVVEPVLVEQTKVTRQDSKIPVGVVTPVSGSYDRKNMVVDTRDAEPTRPSVSAFDCDEDKYRRRSLREWLTRWFRLHSISKDRDDPLSANLRRWIILFIIGVIVLLTCILMLTRVTNDHATNDPFVHLGHDNKVQINPK
ncbi:zinc finger protein-like 1 [Bolinopsis microptera]|uniref:zinc finger protein-like 1 n=1 Tax=Bolinopsis microptera TaxID=2820187 RepID=UPI003079E228